MAGFASGNKGGGRESGVSAADGNDVPRLFYVSQYVSFWMLLFDCVTPVTVHGSPARQSPLTSDMEMRA